MKRRMEFIASKIQKGHCTKIEVRRAVGVSKSSWHRHLAATQQRTERAAADLHLSQRIHQIWRESDRVYGSLRVTSTLNEQGTAINRKRVIRLMKALGIFSVMPHQRIHTTVPVGKVAGDLLKRHFLVQYANQVWVTDITFIPTDEGWLYLCAVTDLFSRQVVGFAAEDHLRTELVLQALQSAVRTRKPKYGLILHSDRGCQFTSGEFQDALTKFGIRSSMGQVGSCFDNACAESFWASLKKEKLARYRWHTRDEAKRAIRTYITWYNTARHHSTLGYVAPATFELRAAA